MRIDKWLSNMGHGSRRDVKSYCKAGRVSVNGVVTKDPGHQVMPDSDVVALDGVVIPYVEFIYLMMNKPRGIISATEDVHEKTVIDLLAPSDRALAPFPVGRLDKDTEGLLLITNDGALAHQLLSPRKHVDKVYEANIAGIVDDQDVTAFLEGVVFRDDGYRTLPGKLDIVSVDVANEQSAIRLTIQEGKFHQVKRMFEAVDKRVTYLRRIAMGPLELDPALPIGRYRHLTSTEIESLQHHQGGERHDPTNPSL